VPVRTADQTATKGREEAKKLRPYFAGYECGVLRCRTFNANAHGVIWLPSILGILPYVWFQFAA
jgi:hypothetical protein